MKLQALASMIALREGKKSQARIGDIREILSILPKINFETLNGVERFLRKETAKHYSILRAQAEKQSAAKKKARRKK